MASNSSFHQLRQLEESFENEQDHSQSALTYRQKRRIDQVLKTVPKRGPTTGKKYFSEKEKNPEVKPKIDFTEEFRRVVGKHVDMFICDCSQWVKEFCPLDSVNWSKMNQTSIKRLYDQIKCSGLYRGWRYRLKEKHFVCHSRQQSRENRPAEVEREKCVLVPKIGRID